MISQLRGRVVSRHNNFIVLDVGGVGYGVHIPLSTYTRLEGMTGEITLLTHTHVTQDAIQLFGFTTSVEKDLFKLLITVSGVGPRLAVNILSGISPEDLSAAIERGEEARLCKVPGIGRKTAARLITELRDQVKKLELERRAGAPEVTVRDDILSALINLGYPEPRAARALEEAAKAADATDFETLLKRALASLAK
ncbi:MAG: Holliday junction branch migration protein RuvA [Acidobacteriota bacterium]